MTKRLQVLLYVIAAYMAIFGALFLFAPATARTFTKTPYDPSLDLLYAQYALTLAFAAFLAAREKQATSRLSLVVLVLTIGHVLVFGYLLLSGKEAFAQAGAPLIVNALLGGLLAWFRRTKRDAY
jgi:predicted permease